MMSHQLNARLFNVMHNETLGLPTCFWHHGKLAYTMPPFHSFYLISDVLTFEIKQMLQQPFCLFHLRCTDGLNQVPYCIDTSRQLSLMAYANVTTSPVFTNSAELEFSQHHTALHCRWGDKWNMEQKCAPNYNKWHDNLFSCTAISMLVISNHNSLRVLFKKIASVYFIWIIC